MSLCSEESQKLLINVETNLDIKITNMFKDYHTFANQVRLSAENIAKFQNETFGTFKQGQRLFLIQ